ncbi:MAG: site-specific integrase [Actinomycetota bacterium]|nr:site-specific integrase [Actinomycetota bacterium]
MRYWVNGKQVEKSFRDKQHPTTGRVEYGSGRKLARDWQLKLTVDKRSGDIAFTDHSKSGKENFGEACELFIVRLPVLDASKGNYLSVYRTHVKPVFGDMTLTQVANDRGNVMDLLAVTMKNLSNSSRQQARYVIVATLDEAVKAGKLSKHRLDGIELADHGRYSRKNFVFPAYKQVSIVANGGRNPKTKRAVGGAGLCVWLMRGCGLRIEEALAVCKEDFIEEGTVLRVAWQASGDGTRKLPLKHRKAGEYRDVPAPSWLWEMVRDMPDGPLSPGNGRLFQQYGTILFRFTHAAEIAGIADGFTPHSLRHAFASAMLAQGVQITELAHFLGHRDINVTHQVYGHLLPSAAKRAVAALDAEFAAWSSADGKG